MDKKKKKYNIKKKAKQQISFRLKEDTIKKLKTIEKYHSKIDRIINLGMNVLEELESKNIDDFAYLKIITNEEDQNIKKLIEDNLKLRAELSEILIMIESKKTTLNFFDESKFINLKKDLIKDLID